MKRAIIMTCINTTETLMAGRRSSNSMISDHLWGGSIPTKLEEGVHQIEVKATDMYGKTYTRTSSYRLENPK